MSTIPGTTIPPGSEKHHFLILDGLRGVAAMVVVWFHVFEAYTTGHTDQIINHGYLAVDFFFMLSGFVIGYAYDKRMETLSTWEFLKRRSHTIATNGGNGGSYRGTYLLFSGLCRMGCFTGDGNIFTGSNDRQRTAHTLPDRNRNTRPGRNVPAERPQLVSVF